MVLTLGSLRPIQLEVPQAQGLLQLGHLKVHFKDSIYHLPILEQTGKSAFERAVLSSAEASNLHVDT